MKRGSVVTSRIGKRPVALPEGVGATYSDGELRITSANVNGSLRLPDDLTVKIDSGIIHLLPTAALDSNNRRVGLFRALIANMVSGALEPFTKQLLLVGTGYRAELNGQALELRVGYSHTVTITVPDQVEVVVDKQTTITLKSPHKELLGTFAASVRAVRPPDAYKGKGIRYADESISLKPGKAAKAVGAGAAA